MASTHLKQLLLLKTKQKTLINFHHFHVKPGFNTKHFPLFTDPNTSEGICFLCGKSSGTNQVWDLPPQPPQVHIPFHKKVAQGPVEWDLHVTVPGCSPGLSGTAASSAGFWSGRSQMPLKCALRQLLDKDQVFNGPFSFG